MVGTSLGVQLLRLCLPMQGVWVQSLVRELRSHMPPGQKKQNIKQKQNCNKFNKDFKRWSISKKENLWEAHGCLMESDAVCATSFLLLEVHQVLESGIRASTLSPAPPELPLVLWTPSTHPCWALPGTGTAVPPGVSSSSAPELWGRLPPRLPHSEPPGASALSKLSFKKKVKYWAKAQRKHENSFHSFFFFPLGTSFPFSFALNVLLPLEIKLYDLVFRGVECSAGCVNLRPASLDTTWCTIVGTSHTSEGCISGVGVKFYS